jgi:TRAP transporter TAXI family solute receptor
MPVYKFATGATLGAYYPIGGSIAEILSDEADDYIINAYSSKASVSNMQLLKDKQTDMALVQSNIAYWGYQGIDMFTEKVENIAGIASLYPEYVQLIVLEDGGIDTFFDLKGKRISIGEETSGNYFDAVSILSEHGITLADIDPVTEKFDSSASMLASGEIDGMIITSGVPNSSIERLLGDVKLKLMDMDLDVMKALVSKNPYYDIKKIEKGEYSGMSKGVMTLSVQALWICQSDMSEDLVYEMTKTFWEKSGRMWNVHDSAQLINLNTVLNGMSIPLHEGAKKYYEDLGIDVN